MTNKQIIIPIAVVAVIAAWFYALPKASQVGELKQAETSPKIESVPKEVINSKVEVYAPAAKKKIGLPKDKQDDKSLAVLGASKLPSGDHPQTVITTLDTDTGKIETEVRVEPLPWLAAEKSGYLRLSYGIKTGKGKIGRLSVSENLVQIKALHAGIDASLDTDGQGYAGVHVDYCWQ